MEIKKQLQLMTYFFLALLLTIGLLLLTGAFGTLTLVQSQNWVNHSNYVLNELKTAKKDFTLADFAGRNRIFTGANTTDLVLEREKAMLSIGNLKIAMADNAEQLSNIEALEKAVASRFKVQDEQYTTVTREGDKITYDLDTLSKSVAFTETIDTLFYQIELNELNLVRINRMPRLVFWQWMIIYAGFGVVVLLLSVTIVVFILHRKILNRLVTVGEAMESFIHQTEANESLQSDLQKFNEFIKGATNELPNSSFTISRAQ